MEENNLTTLWEPVLRHDVRISFERLTDADVLAINGDAATFLSILQERYGYTPVEAEVAMNTFMKRYLTFDDTQAGEAAAAQAPALNG